MNQDRKNKVDARRGSAFGKIEHLHPIRMLLYLSMVGIGVLFFVLVVAFVRTGGFGSEQFSLPKFFSISTLFLLFSSYTISKVPRIYKKDKLRKMTRYLAMTFLLGVAFIGAQILGWRELTISGAYFTGKASGSYLYLITALHLLHLLGGMIFLAFLLIKTAHMAGDGVRSLIFIRDPYRRLQLTMLNTYWHFLGAIWLTLYLVILFMA
ncbi:cytochrome c oxidase subunit 3 [Pontibacter indicus]|uniref:Cytochrome c oxidase subunit 3 n=1 Tax=Pontibacter indicus TaxID=1317125 RepID=A0A1R3WZC0_9BACT|nr:cytochrome c oxidase subunit 3 [Pontibacter indicus]SIT82276.1 cytochrome c oxidase subunit 3 [Pontibacter indicus]